MRIAVVSDVHGNGTAFEAVLADLRQTAPDLIFHGGDLADGGSAPTEIIDRIRDLGWPGIVGNTDEMLFAPESLEVFANDAPVFTLVRENAAATRVALGEERIAWLSKLPRQQAVDSMTLLHARPGDLWRAPAPDAGDSELESVYGPLRQKVVIYAHIHRPYIRNLPGMTIGNTGSVSLSFDGDRRASYLLLDEGVPSIRRVEYDVDREVKALASSTLPHSAWIAKMLLVLLLVCCKLPAQAWVSQNTGTLASLRGVSAVGAKVVWASGSGGTWLRTTDGGMTWHSATVPDATTLDFRGIKAIDENTAFLMSSGSGDKSRIFKTTDAGASWKLLFTNPDAKGFFDAIAFRDARHGIIAGDQVDREMVIFTTDDGGAHWTRRHTPPALANEGGFAASNSCLFVRGKDAWFGTGASRIIHSGDGGLHWTAAATPMRHDSASAGIFSIAFSDSRHGIAVGGDYAKDKEAQQNIAMTSDGGRSWTKSEGPAGFRSAVLWVSGKKLWIATGTSGSDVSSDGKTWRNFDTSSFNALSEASGAVWAVGAKGRVATMNFADAP